MHLNFRTQLMNYHIIFIFMPREPKIWYQPFGIGCQEVRHVDIHAIFDPVFMLPFNEFHAKAVITIKSKEALLAGEMFREVFSCVGYDILKVLSKKYISKH